MTAENLHLLEARALEAEKRQEWETAAARWFHCHKAGDPQARLRQAECLHLAGRQASGTRMAIRLLTGEVEADAEVLARLELFAGREIAAGLSLSPGMILKALAGFPGLERARLGLAVRLASAAGGIDQASCRLYDAVLAADPVLDARTVATAVSRLWMRNGPSRDLLDRLRRNIPDPQARGPMELKLLAALDDRIGVAQLLADLPVLVPRCADTPSLPAMVLDPPGLIPPGAEREALEKARRRFARAERDRHRLWQRLADPGLSIAVVGNSPVELGRGRGPEIDSHDIVVRFNHFSLAPGYVADYGRKVSVIVRSGAEDPSYDLHMSQNRDTIISGLRLAEITGGWKTFNKLSDRGIPVSWFPQDMAQPLADLLHARPSSGTYFLQTLRHFRQDLRNVDFYGFAFTDQTGAEAGPAHYFDSARPSLPHDWQHERRLYDQLVAERDRQRQLRPAEASTRLRVRILGDHSAYHCGSAAVMEVLNSRIGAAARIVSAEEPYDVLVINGEGSMHHRSTAHVGKMEAAREAQALGRPWHLVNSVWQENGDADRALMATAASITLREVLSQQALQRDLGIEGQVLPDLSWLCEIDEEAPFTDHGGATVVSDFYSVEFGNFVRMTGGPFARMPWIDMKAASWSSLVLSLRTARLLVTGRHHAVYAACKARIPFVALAGNTHKIEGLIASAGVDIPVCRHPSELPAAVKAARARQAEYAALFDWLDAQPRWSAEVLCRGPGA